MKKNIIILFLIVAILLLILRIVITNNYDVNNDGKVNSKDLLDLRNYLIKKGDDK